ncbi:hypothetical protein BDW68DRAFT_82984 [Aspergillus falconensis]
MNVRTSGGLPLCARPRLLQNRLAYDDIGSVTKLTPRRSQPLACFALSPSLWRPQHVTNGSAGGETWRGLELDSVESQDPETVMRRVDRYQSRANQASGQPALDVTLSARFNLTDERSQLCSVGSEVNGPGCHVPEPPGLL